MQGKLIIGALLFAGLAAPAIAGEQVKRSTCDKADNSQPARERSQQAQPPRDKAPECRTPRNIPPVVDPTPWFLL